jgi:ribose transport system substrate-binding protein
MPNRMKPLGSWNIKKDVISLPNNPWFIALEDTAKQCAEEPGYEATVFDSQKWRAVDNV